MKQNGNINWSPIPETTLTILEFIQQRHEVSHWLFNTQKLLLPFLFNSAEFINSNKKVQ